MKIEVLVSTVNKGFELVEKMNIRTDALIVNQCDEFNYDEVRVLKNNIRVFSFNERGTGISRNTALMRTKGDICLFADDDLTYDDDYESKIISAFNKYKDADMIVFNVISKNPDREEYIDEKDRRVRIYNCMRYGGFRMAVRVDSIRKANIYFPVIFGGGAKYGSGEDTLFISNCIKKGLKVYASAHILGCVDHEESSWFHGYDSKYFHDKGALFAALSKNFAEILSLQYLIRKKKSFNIDRGLFDLYKNMKAGIKDYENIL